MLLTEAELQEYAGMSRAVVPDDEFLELLPRIAEKVRTDPVIHRLRDPFSLLALMATEILQAAWKPETPAQPRHVVTATIHRIMEEWTLPEWWPWSRAETEASLTLDFGTYAAEMQWNGDPAPGGREPRGAGPTHQ